MSCWRGDEILVLLARKTVVERRVILGLCWYEMNQNSTNIQ